MIDYSPYTHILLFHNVLLCEVSMYEIRDASCFEIIDNAGSYITSSSNPVNIEIKFHNICMILIGYLVDTHSILKTFW